MSIFFDVVKLFLKEGTRLISVRASDVDASAVNQQLSFFMGGFARSEEDRVKEKKVLDDLQIALNAEEATSSHPDDVLANRLKMLIKSHRCKLGLFNQKKTFFDNQCEEELLKLESLVDLIYEKMERFGLLNKSNDGDPWHCFLFYCAKFLANNVFAEHLSSMMQKLFYNKSYVSDKEQLLAQQLHICKENLSALKPKGECFERVKTRMIRYCLDDVLRGEASIDAKYVLKLGGPKLTWFKDCLEECMIGVRTSLDETYMKNSSVVELHDEDCLEVVRPL